MKTIRLLTIILMFLAAFLLMPSLPSMIPSHWNIQGEVDGYMPKPWGALFFPLLALFIAGLFEFLPKLDPNKSKYRIFAPEWEIIKTVFLVFFAYMEFVVLYLTANAGNIVPFIFAGIGILFTVLGNYLSKIRQNYFIGIKTPWTLSSEDNWNKTHRFASWCFVGAGIITLANAFLDLRAPAAIFGVIMLMAILPIIYSYLLYRRTR